MITGAASADAALLLIDAGHGVQQQSRLHGYLLHLLGIRQIAVLVNKMDLVGWSQARFDEIQGIYTAYLAGIGVTPRSSFRSRRVRATPSPTPAGAVLV